MRNFSMSYLILAFADLPAWVSYNQFSLSSYQKNKTFHFAKSEALFFNVTSVCDSNQDLITSI